MKATVVAMVVIVLAVGAFLFYQYSTTTPQFAFGQAGLSVGRHDLQQFKARVDSQSLIESAIRDLLTDPLENTPGLTDLQHAALSGALGIARNKVSQALSEQLEQYIENGPAPKAASAQPERNSELKAAVARKMLAYGKSHPQSFAGKILSLPEEDRKAELKTIISDCGFTPSNFKGIAYCNETGSICTTGAKFFSPRLNHEIVIDIQQNKTDRGWQITKISNLHAVVTELEPAYDADLQQVAIYSVEQVKSAVASKAQEVMSVVRNSVSERVSNIRNTVLTKIRENRPAFAPPIPVAGDDEANAADSDQGPPAFPGGGGPLQRFRKLRELRNRMGQ